MYDPSQGPAPAEGTDDPSRAGAAGPPPLPPASPPPIPAAAPARGPRFCGTCGAPWQPHWAACESCAVVTGFGYAPVPGGPAVGHAAPAGEEDGIIRIHSALKLYFSLLAVSVIGTIAALAGAPEVPLELVMSAAFSAVVLVWCGLSNPVAVLRLLKPARVVWYPVAVLTAGATLAVAFGVVETFHRVWGVEKLGYAGPYLAGGYGLWLAVLVICVQPAVFEELAFRGVMLTGLRPTLSDAEAVVVSAMLFMTLHVSPAAFPHTLAMGVAAGFIRLWSGSILPCVLLHMLHNTGVIVAEVYLNV